MKALMISGVDVSTPTEPAGPKSDHSELREHLRADVFDTVTRSSSRASRSVARVFGPHWGVAFEAWRRSRDYDAVFATGEDVGLRLAALLKLTRRRSRLVMTCHNISTRRPTVFLRYLRVGSAVAVFQCLARSQVGYLLERDGRVADRIQLLWWQVDHDYYRHDPATPTKQQICSAGSSSRDYATLARAADGLAIDVKIAAFSPWSSQSTNVVASALPPNVEAVNHVTCQALRALYDESLFVVVPLLDVDFSAGYTGILEAMAMGKAVIATRTRQRDDFIVDGWNGLYVEPGDVADLRAKIELLLDGPELARRLGANGRAAVEERYTLKHYAERVVRALGGDHECSSPSAIETGRSADLVERSTSASTRAARVPDNGPLGQ